MKGEAYLGFSNAKNPETNSRTNPQDRPRSARSLKPPCASDKCRKSKNRFCVEFTQDVREMLFNEFWSTLNWNAKKAYVKSLVDQIVPQRCRAKGKELKRHETFLYHLKLNGIRKQVCKKMFLNTLGLGEKQVRGWVSKPNKSSTTIPKNKNVKGGDVSFARKFLTDIPKLPSHYCRADTKKHYLEPIFRTKTHLYEVYQEKCKESAVKEIVKGTFFILVDKMNIGMYQPKKDRCDTCCAWEVGNIPDEDYNVHISKKNAARTEKVKDKEEAEKGNVHVICMDVQKVLLSPMLNASALYYKTKLIVHNFTVFNLTTRQATCYLWDETQADLVGSVFATCLVDYMEKHFKDDIPVIIYSDGCTSQNRNAIMSNALLHFSARTNKVIFQKYLEKGHTQMEVDSVHSKIETNIHGRPIYLPSDYTEICRTARKAHGGYDVKVMTFENFLDFSSTRAYKSIRPGTRKTDPHVTDIRQIKYKPNGTLEYKLEHNVEFIPFPRRFRVDPNTKFPQLYRNLLPVAKRKYDDLLDLLHVLPETCHDFYKNLPHKTS